MLLDHAESNNLIPEYQSTYRPFHSCETKLLKLVNNVLLSMENQKNYSSGGDGPIGHIQYSST